MTDNNTPPQAAPGWYPVDADTVRYWDGKVWTEHTQPVASHVGTGTPGATTATSEAAVKEPTAKKKALRWWVWVILGLSALLVLVIVIGSINSANKPPTGRAPISQGQDAKEEPAAEDDPEPEPESGSLELPFPKGYELTVYEGSPDNTLATMTIAIKDPNAGAAIAQANQFNDPAQPGYHYVAVDYTITGASKTEPVNASQLLYDWTLSQADGVQIAENKSSVVLPDGWNHSYDLNDLYEGQTGTVTVIYQVPDAYAGTLYATAYGQYITL